MTMKLSSGRALACAAVIGAGILGVAAVAPPAFAQSTTGTETQNAPAATGGQLPSESLPGQRQGAIGGAPVPQGSSGTSNGSGNSSGSGSATGSTPGGGSAAPTGQLPDTSLQQQRQGTIGGDPVTQGGSGGTAGSTDKQGQQ
ncbi:hypothetical protein [Azospirillum lipoferum]|uniref:hypothetical protein n=1 Tax=Azospirillum lipoferum TaxID=193 RepID=UPI001395FF1A|nr:hypothetical protein [Azospirillum lipoferum]